MYTYEIFLAKSDISAEEWQQFLASLLRCVGFFESFEIRLLRQHQHIKYLLLTKRQLPATVENLPDFFIKKVPLQPFASYTALSPCLAKINNFIEAIEYFSTRYNITLRNASIKLRKLPNGSSCRIKVQSDQRSYWLPLASPANFLAINFSKNQTFFWQKPTKTPDVKKLLPALSNNPANSILSVSAFPYTQEQLYLHQDRYNFAKHSLVVGASGSGKSKFLSLFIRNLAMHPELQQQYQIILIDPHDALKNDLSTYGRTIDFQTPANSINLFAANSENYISSTETTYDLLSALIGQSNPKLNRMLHHACYLLLAGRCFSFTNLRHLLTDLDFRNQLVRQLKPYLPFSIINFFLSDFNEMRTKYYTEAISPILTFLDELETAPVFSQAPPPQTLYSVASQNFLTIFSLNRTILGQKTTLAISGLILQQLFSIIQSTPPQKKLLVIIDEVAVIENPSLSRYLSEARKYNVALILATQYLGQISSELQKAIFANITNYYLFRISRSDAELFAKNIDIKFSATESATDDKKIQLLTGLNPRECIAQIDLDNKITPAFMAKTTNF